MYTCVCVCMCMHFCNVLCVIVCDCLVFPSAMESAAQSVGDLTVYARAFGRREKMGKLLGKAMLACGTLYYNY